MAIDSLCDDRGAVADEVGDLFDRHPGLRHQRDEGVPQFARRPAMPYLRLLAHAPEGAPHVPVEHRRADSAGKHQAVLLPPVARNPSVALLLLPLLAEGIDTK